MSIFKENALKRFISICLPLLLLDMAVKWWIARAFPELNWLYPYFPYGGLAVVRDFHSIYFSVVHATNKGAALGVFADYQYYLLIARMALIGLLTLFLLFFNKNRSLQIPFILILTGAIGNVVDYFIYGHVIDMWNLQAFGINFPIFNMADAYVTLGIVWLFFHFLLDKKKSSRDSHIGEPSDFDLP